MAKNRKSKRSIGSEHSDPAPTFSRARRWLAPTAVAIALAGAVVALRVARDHWHTLPVAEKAGIKGLPELHKMTVAQAVMVTVELDFGPQIPPISEALREIERGYVPDDGKGRTFAILDANGGPTADGKLHISMHVSSEKPGMGTLVFRRTGEVLWRARIGAPGDAPAGIKNLGIMLDDGAGRGWTLDGTRGGDSVLDVFLRDSSQRVREVWADGAEREVTFIYSACGCPVKVKVRREGERTVRTKDVPVIFPDDAPAVTRISQLMKW